jgi:cytochrome c-type biogenesis protein CcmH/NrfG
MIRRKLEECPGDANCWFHLGSHLRVTGRFVEAEEALKRAVELDSTHDSAWIGLALLYTETSRPEESLSAWTEAYKAQELRNGGVGY